MPPARKRKRSALSKPPVNHQSEHPMSTVYDRFRASALQRGDADFLCVEEVTAANYGIEAQTISWRAAIERVEALKEAYSEAGYGHGHRVGLLLENRPDHLFHWLALNALGASVVPISAEMRRLMADPAEIDRVLHQGSAKARTIAAPIVAETKKLVGFIT